MAKAKQLGTATLRFVQKKRTKSERTSPKGKKRKPYRGQGRA